MFFINIKYGSKGSSIFWDVTQRRLQLFIDVEGQPIGPIYKGQADVINL
jgi:hypothetical protein